MRNTSRITLGIVSICIIGRSVLADDPTAKFPGLHFIPWPKSVQLGSGEMPLTPQSRIAFVQPELKPLAEILAEELLLATGLKLGVSDGPGRDGDIVLRINKELRADEKIRTLRNLELAYTTDGA